MAENILAKLLVQISANNADFIKGVNSSQKQLASFTSGLTKVAGTLGVAFSAQQVISFASEVTKLAGEAEGVRNAFDKLPGATRLMEDLKAATGGTVSELDLMKRAVQASNFDISLQSLPKLLEFAAVRAQQTGESVDYLVNSIVTGIGRKSPLILDNLGISATRLREEMNGVSLASAEVGDVSEAVGRIAAEELEKMGGLAETTSTKTQRLAASWTNLKVAIGEAGNETGIFSGAVDAATKAMDLFSSNATSQWQKLGALSTAVVTGGLSLVALGFEDSANKADAAAEAQKRLELVQRSADEAIAKFGSNIGLFIQELVRLGNQQDLVAEITSRIADQDKKRAAEIENIANLTAKLNTLLQERQTLTGRALADTNNEIKGIREKIKALEDLGTATRSIAPEPIKIPIEFELPEINTRELLDAINTITGGIQVQPVDFLSGEKEHTEATSEHIKALKEQAFADAEQMRQLLTSSIQSAIQAEQSFASALANITLDIVDSFLNQALAAAASKALQTPGAPYPVALALAVSAFGIVKGLFKKNINKSGGGGGGGSALAGGGGLAASSRTRDFQTERAAEQIVLVGGEFKVRGGDLVLAIDQTTQKRQRTG